MPNEFPAVDWNAETEAAARRLVKMALEEDLAGGVDLTSHALADPQATGAARFVAREAGIVAGLPILPLVADEANADVRVEVQSHDGAAVSPGESIAQMTGRVIDLLTCERTMLNFLGRLSGVASLTGRFVEEVSGTAARVYDTRKTTPGWRLLEKYAVHCGGGVNHRLGLASAVLIKDNHLAHCVEQGASPADAVTRARRSVGDAIVVEVEVDSLEQLACVLPVQPDIVLLDNMTLPQLRQAVAMRNETAPGVTLEASGGVRLDTIGAIAKTGVDRISAGALTHSSGSLDIGLDWSA